jgi:hypothetical protein
MGATDGTIVFWGTSFCEQDHCTLKRRKMQVCDRRAIWKQSVWAGNSAAGNPAGCTKARHSEESGVICPGIVAS